MARTLTWTRKGTFTRTVEILDEDHQPLGRLIQKGLFSHKTSAQLRESKFIFDYKASLMDNVVVKTEAGVLIGKFVYDFGLDAGVFKFEEEGREQLTFSKSLKLTDFTFTLSATKSPEVLTCTINMNSTKMSDGKLEVPDQFDDLQALLLVHLVTLK